jgi:tetratricopeptide (TPR) repeat protein
MLNYGGPIMNKSSSKDADKWVSKGIAMRKLGKYSEALECFNKAIKANPQDTYPWVIKGNYLDNLKHHDEALACFNKALELNPNCVDAWNGKGLALENLGVNKQAEICFQTAKSISTDPDKPKFNGFCNFCHISVSKIEIFYCKYCKTYHCPEHRLPEQHSCKNAKTPKGMKGGRIIYSKGKTIYLPK